MFDGKMYNGFPQDRVTAALLTDDRGDVVHGHHPTAAFDSAGRLTILYEGTGAAAAGHRLR